MMKTLLYLCIMLCTLGYVKVNTTIHTYACTAIIYSMERNKKNPLLRLFLNSQNKCVVDGFYTQLRIIIHVRYNISLPDVGERGVQSRAERSALAMFECNLFGPLCISRRYWSTHAECGIQINGYRLKVCISTDSIFLILSSIFFHCSTFHS